MRLKELIKSIDNGIVSSSRGINFEVKGISCYSKSVKDGFVFVAIKGVKEDGAKFIKEAIANGAKAVIVQSPVASRQSPGEISFIRVKDARGALAKLAAQFYANPSSKIKVTGITGTNGKTTVSYLIEAILKEARLVPAVIGTINYRFKDKIIVSRNTTPGPVELQSMLYEMLNEGVTDLVMEVSSHALDQERTEGVKFHSAIFTNLTQDHLDYHKTKEDYFLAKSKLFKGINSHSFGIINNDDSYGSRLKKLVRSEIVTYGIDKKSDVTAKNIAMDITHTAFALSTPTGSIDLNTQLIGKHNVYNILASAAWAFKEGLDLRVVKSAIEKFTAVPGRLERVATDKDFYIFVDYAHTEDALKNVIEALRKICQNKIIVVFGCGGERDKTKRPKMGGVVSALADYAIITNDNPRSEDPAKIIEDIERGFKKNNYCVISDRFEAVKKSLLLAERGDIVLVAGKGHENYQIFNDKRVHFDDREAIIECLKLMN